MRGLAEPGWGWGGGYLAPPDRGEGEPFTFSDDSDPDFDTEDQQPELCSPDNFPASCAEELRPPEP